MIKYLIFVALLLLTFITYAQEGSINGLVKDASTNEPLEYASVALYKVIDSSLVTGVITNQSGKFKLEKIDPGSYFIQTQFLGYEIGQSEKFTLEVGQNYQMPLISLEPGSQMMNEVKVTGRRINTFNKLDKQSYNAGQFESAKGGTAIDVLKNMPSVAVNGQGEISIRGATGFLLMINGKPVITDPQTALGQLPANMINNIELITSPSAKYDPDGKAGIINIITKKGGTDGTGLSVNTQYGLPSITDFNNDRTALRYGVDILLNYSKNRWDIAVGGNYTRNDLAGFREGNVFIENVGGNIVTRFPSRGERSFNRFNYAAMTSISYKANSSNIITFGYYSGKRYQERDANLFYGNSTWTLDTGEKISDNPYFNANKQIKQGKFTIANLDYTHIFTNNSSLKGSILYEYDDLYGTTHNRNLTEPGGSLIQYVQNPYQKPIDGFRFKVDHSIPLKNGGLESGYQFRSDSQDGNFDYIITPEDPNQPNLDQFRGTAISRNQIHSLYSQYTGTFKSLQYNAGLRYEFSRRTVKLSFDPEEHLLELSNFFPSASALYSFNTGLKLKAGFSRRIQRSTNNQLNPIPEREHSETLEIGDPDLLPEFVNLAEIGIIKSLQNGGSLFLTSYYQASKNPVQRVNSIYADTILNRVYTNVKRGDVFGFESGADLRFFKWFDFYMGVNIFNQRYQGSLKILNSPPIDINNAGWAYSINVNSSFHISPSINLQANINYLSKRVTAQGEDSRYLIPNLSLKKSFLNNRLIASIQWQNIDLGMKETNRQRITTQGKNFYTTTNYIYETDFILLNLSYNLNKRNSKSKLPSSEFGEKEF